ncbi:MAG: PEGA domain-containing protein [bacterium]|nr:PEGA domain-containing protein [bacterium]
MKKILIFLILWLYTYSSLANSLPTIAIVDMEPVGCEDAIAIAVGEILRTEIINTYAFQVVERGQLNKLLEEHSLQLSGLIDDATIAKAGAIIGVEYIGVGSISKIGNTYTLSLRVINVSTGLAILGKTVTVTNLDELASKCKDIAWDLTDKENTQTQGNLDINSTPAGASVYIDGELTGKTPLSLTLEPGEYVFHLVKDGFYEETKQLLIMSGTNQPLKLTLVPMAQQIEKRNEDSGTIWVILGIAALVGLSLLLASSPAPSDTGY